MSPLSRPRQGTTALLLLRCGGSAVGGGAGAEHRPPTSQSHAISTEWLHDLTRVNSAFSRRVSSCCSSARRAPAQPASAMPGSSHAGGARRLQSMSPTSSVTMAQRSVPRCSVAGGQRRRDPRTSAFRQRRPPAPARSAPARRAAPAPASAATLASLPWRGLLIDRRHARARTSVARTAATVPGRSPASRRPTPSTSSASCAPARLAQASRWRLPRRSPERRSMASMSSSGVRCVMVRSQDLLQVCKSVEEIRLHRAD